MSEQTKRAPHTDRPSELTYELLKIGRIRAVKLAVLILRGISVLAVTVQLLLQRRLPCVGFPGYDR